MKRTRPATAAGTPQPAAVRSTQQAAAASGDTLELQIREAAYYRYLARGAAVGQEMADWLQAEAELLQAQTADDTAH